MQQKEVAQMRISKIKTTLYRDIKISIIAVLFLMSFNVYAEYYIVMSGCGGCGPGWRTTKHVYKKIKVRNYFRRPCVATRVVSPVAFYQVAPVDSSCWCGEAWVPGHCGPCARWVPGYWEPRRYNSYYRAPRYINDRVYDPDLATADDDADIHPDMQINY